MADTNLKPKKMTKSDKEFLRGFAVAAAIVTRWGCTGEKLLKEGGYTLDDLRRADVEPGDIHYIRYGGREADETDEAEVPRG